MANIWKAIKLKRFHFHESSIVSCFPYTLAMLLHMNLSKKATEEEENQKDLNLNSKTSVNSVANIRIGIKSIPT